MSTFILHAKDKFRPTVLLNVLAFIPKLSEEKSWEIKIEPYRKERTGKQNRGLFGVGYPPLMEYCGYQGDADKKELHRDMCGEFFGWVDIPTGGRRPARTTTTDEHGKHDVVPWDTFCSFYAFVQRRGAELGVYIPDPDPLWRETKENAK